MNKSETRFYFVPAMGFLWFAVAACIYFLAYCPWKFYEAALWGVTWEYWMLGCLIIGDILVVFAVNAEHGF